MTPEALDLAVWPIFSAMTERGLLVDVAKLRALRAEVDTELGVQRALAEAYAGWAIDPENPHHVRRWLDESGLYSQRRTKTGMVATDERALALLLDAHPLPGTVLECRGLAKLLSTFIDPLLVRAGDAATLVVHPRWRLTRTRSGRPSCEDPNLLAFPTRDKFGRRVRECFVARPGYAMVSIDFSQIEPRVGAALSQDAGLVAVFAQKLDLYADTARKLFRISLSDKELKGDEDLSRKYRQPSKVIWLACILNGMAAKHLYEEFLKYGVGTAAAPYYDVAACEDFVRRRFEPYPGLGELVQATVREAVRNDGVVHTHGGRTRFLPALLLDGRRWPASSMRAEAERQAFNHLIQGTAQEIMKSAMLRVEARRLQVHPLLQVYDELVVEVPEREAEALRDELVRVMSTTLDGVAIPAGGSVAATWGTLK